MANNKSPIFRKASGKERIILKDSNRTITNNHELAETFNTFFSNITQNLRIDSNLVEITENFNTPDPVLKAVKKYEKHPSIIKITETMKNKNTSFSFSDKEKDFKWIAQIESQKCLSGKWYSSQNN